jgi:hypothetical protein
MSPLQQVAEMKYAAVHSEEFSFEGTVSALCHAKFLGEESQQLPCLSRLPLLQYGAEASVISTSSAAGEG